MRHLGTGPAAALAGADVAVVGLFSGKDQEFDAKLDGLADAVRAHGGRVVGRHVQRRGVSHGGVAEMDAPFACSPRRAEARTCTVHQVSSGLTLLCIAISIASRNDRQSLAGLDAGSVQRRPDATRPKVFGCPASAPMDWVSVPCVDQ